MRTLKYFLIFSITLICFILIAAAGSAGISAYLYYKEKRSISQTEEEMKDLGTTLTEACAQISELANPAERQKRLQKFFADNREKALYDRAFLVAADGKIIAHSDPAEAKNLNFNIASDEFSYNLDLILHPLQNEKETLFFADYNIIEKQIPFSREEIKYIKKYLYPGIDRNGWIASKAVTEHGKKNAVVSIIISKDRIYVPLKNDILWIKKGIPWIAGGAAGSAFIIFLLVLIVSLLNGKRKTAHICADNSDNLRHRPQEEYVDAVVRQRRAAAEPIIIYEEIDEGPKGRFIIQDAIPVRKR